MDHLSLAWALIGDPILWVYVLILGFPVRGITEGGDMVVQVFGTGILCLLAGVVYSAIAETMLARQYLDHALDLEVYIVRSVLTAVLLLVWSSLLKWRRRPTTR